MKTGRFAIPVAIVLLVALTAVVGRSLWLDLRELSTAGTDNAQWTILQLDSETATLYATLLEELGRPDPGIDRVVLRTEIALSRIDLVSQGVAAEIVSSDDRGVELLNELRDFSDEAVLLLDGGLRIDELARLTQLADEIRPSAREIALLGIAIGAERSEASRHAFSTRLWNTGVVAIAVIGILAGVLIFVHCYGSRAKEASH